MPDAGPELGHAGGTGPEDDEGAGRRSQILVFRMSAGGDVEIRKFSSSERHAGSELGRELDGPLPLAGGTELEHPPAHGHGDPEVMLTVQRHAVSVSVHSRIQAQKGPAPAEGAGPDIVVEFPDDVVQGVDEEEVAEVGGEGHSIGDPQPLQDHFVRSVPVQPVESPLFPFQVSEGHGAGEDPAYGVRNDVVEAPVGFGRDVVQEHARNPALPPDRHRSPVHEKQ